MAGQNDREGLLGFLLDSKNGLDRFREIRHSLTLN